MSTRPINSNRSSSRETSPEPQRPDSEPQRPESELQSPPGEQPRPPGRLLGAQDRPPAPLRRPYTPARLVILPLADRLSASGLAGLALWDDPGSKLEIRSHLQVAQIATRDAPAAVTLQQFQSLLGVPGAPQREGGSLRTLTVPPHLRDEALLAVGARINALPPADHEQAVQDFLNFPFAFHAPNAVLDELRHAVREMGPRAFVDREARLAARGGVAFHALGRREGTIQEIMQRHSIFSAATNGVLHQYALEIGLSAVENGETTASIIRRLGITDERTANYLNSYAARHAFDQGNHSIDDLAQRFDLSTARPSVEYYAVQAEGRQAVRRGESVLSVAVRIGLREADSLSILAQQAPLETFEQFQALLGDPNFPASPDQRDRALAAVGARIMALPRRADQDRAAQAFMAFGQARSAHRTPLLEALRYTANCHHPAQALAAREALLVSRPGAAATEVTETSNIQDIARRHGISGAHSLRALQVLVYPFAATAVEANLGTVAEVARNRGITDPAMLELLAVRAATVAAQAVAGGEMPADVVRRLGITNEAVVENLSLQGARRAMHLEPHSIDALQQQFGLTPNARHRLELYAVQGMAGAAVRRFESVIGVAARVGIRNADNLSRLVHQVEIRNVDQFRALLNAPIEVQQGLPAPVRAAALAALGGRIMALPESDREAAARAFIEFHHEGESTALFDDLRLAASRGEAGLREREMRLVAPGGAAAAEVGQIDPGDIARRHAISGADAISALQHLASARNTLP